ncbi:hypothetical protein L1987_81432 [Smallanthus sonchifolius]|uniref:Uncharacterized protein n=1 Tax=Smallanthus sonchifolius TaxID=185202 RepID=A0ACB8YUN4_9ASTR|nr:hypothetical protein L1987_81432 [Smallanthus sonchifolius]
MKIFRQVNSHYQVPNPLRVKKFTGSVHIDAISNHSTSSEWCIRTFPKLIKLSHLLKGLDLINERLVNVENKCVVDDEFLTLSMRAFKSTGTAFVMQNMRTCVNKPAYKEPFDVNSLKKICDVLCVSAQQRKLVRLAICPQVTQHQIWTGALMEILNQLEIEMKVKDYGCITKGFNMGRQIVVNCLRFLDDVTSYDPDSASWMWLTPKKDADSPPSAKWADLLEMFNDLINCLKNDHEFLLYVIKLEIMKEGLLQIKDVLVDKNIGYKEALHQQSLVQKKLTKSLGHSSRCLFTLLLYYLYGSIQDIDLDICCWFSEDVAGDKVYLCVGKIMTSDDDKMMMHVVKQLDRVLGVIKFVHEMAEMKEILEIQGHLWCVGSKSKSLAYRGHNFFIHGISLE